MNILFVLFGPTGVGKTALSLNIAKHIGSPILSADSRQIYKEIPIGTAAPTAEQLAQVQHYFIGTHSLLEYYSASLFEEETISLIDRLHKSQPYLLLCGGSMMYIDAVCNGIDDMPTVTQEIRDTLQKEFQKDGLEPILEELKKSDPVHYNEVDRKNYRRVIHAVEICRMTGKPYSSYRTHNIKERPFKICKIGLMREREELFERINNRVDEMIRNGLIDEAQKVYHMRSLNALNTVGFKELFLYFDGIYTLEEAVEKIKRNTRVYARKQITWFKHDEKTRWFNPDNEDDIIQYINSVCNAQ